MALHSLLKVNDQTIGSFYAQRLTGGDRPDDINTYKIEIHKGAWADQDVHEFEITHRYGDGAWLLVAKAIAVMAGM